MFVNLTLTRKKKENNIRPTEAQTNTPNQEQEVTFAQNCELNITHVLRLDK